MFNCMFFLNNFYLISILTSDIENITRASVIATVRLFIWTRTWSPWHQFSVAFFESFRGLHAQNHSTSSFDFKWQVWLTAPFAFLWFSLFLKFHVLLLIIDFLASDLCSIILSAVEYYHLTLFLVKCKLNLRFQVLSHLYLWALWRRTWLNF